MTLLERAKEAIIELRDITRVVHGNGYGSSGFGQEAFLRSLRADRVVEEIEKELARGDHGEKP